jgi:hypothetical protein
MSTKKTERYDLMIGRNAIELPRRATLLCVMGVREVPRLYVAIPDDMPEDPIQFRIEVSGVGADVPASARWISALILGGAEYHAWLL